MHAGLVPQWGLDAIIQKVYEWDERDAANLISPRLLPGNARLPMNNIDVTTMTPRSRNILQQQLDLYGGRTVQPSNLNTTRTVVNTLGPLPDQCRVHPDKRHTNAQCRAQHKPVALLTAQSTATPATAATRFANPAVKSNAQYNRAPAPTPTTTAKRFSPCACCGGRHPVERCFTAGYGPLPLNFSLPPLQKDLREVNLTRVRKGEPYMTLQAFEGLRPNYPIAAAAQNAPRRGNYSNPRPRPVVNTLVSNAQSALSNDFTLGTSHEHELQATAACWNPPVAHPSVHTIVQMFKSSANPVCIDFPPSRFITGAAINVAVHARMPVSFYTGEQPMLYTEEDPHG